MTSHGEHWERTFRENMQRMRKQQGMTQGEFADRIRRRGPAYSQQLLTRVESGDRAIRLGEAFIIADVLGSDVSAMANDAERAEAESIAARYWQARSQLTSAVREVDAASEDARNFLAAPERSSGYEELRAVADGDSWAVHREADFVDENFERLD